MKKWTIFLCVSSIITMILLTIFAFYIIRHGKEIKEKEDQASIQTEVEWREVELPTDL